jgi:glycosyltransferase involved in cell wall biosynthesis
MINRNVTLDSVAGGPKDYHQHLGPPMELSIVVPCMNEEDGLEETNRRLIVSLERLGLSFEILYVDDGSTDSTFAVAQALQARDSRIRVLSLSRNFGHQIAITAGMEHATGAAVVIIDADLQDPPEVIGDLVEQWKMGHDVVYGLRTERQGESAFKIWSAQLFYRAIARLSDIKIPQNVGDFRLMSRRAVDAFLSMPERDRFVRGMVSWLGFSQVAVPYQRAPRMAGETKYPLFKMLKLAADGILSFSIVPLQLATWIGLASAMMAILGIVLILANRLFTRSWVPGWASITIAVLFMGGAQLVCLGLIGEYLGRTYGESKHRPLYLVKARLGFEIVRHEPGLVSQALDPAAAERGPRITGLQVAGGSGVEPPMDQGRRSSR